MQDLKKVNSGVNLLGREMDKISEKVSAEGYGSMRISLENTNV